MNTRKKTLRYLPVFLNLFRSILTPILTLMLSYIIVNYFSKSLWGNFVEIQLYYFIALIFLDWGTKTYLQKAFSSNPKNMVITWQQQFSARIPILLLSTITIILFIDVNSMVLIAWLLSSFFYNSFLSILFYNRDYLLLILIELSSFFLLSLLLYIKKDYITINELILFYTFSMLLKATIVSFKYYFFLKFKSFSINFSNLKFGLPFLLIGITGFLHSKIDIYTYAYFQNNIALGEYQIISSFFIFSQSIITILLFPYIKNIYRINIKSFKKIRKQVAVLGIFFNTTITIIIAYFLKKHFDIKLTFIEYLIGFFIGYPSYIYSIKVFELFKFNKEKKVVIISIIGLLFNLILSIIFLLLDLNTLGVLLANAITQIMTMIIYFLPLSNEELS